MPEPQNNFLIFNEANNSLITMSDEDYASYYYRTSGLIPMEADYKLHNKMYRQWSIMIKAIADMIEDKGYDALDSDLTDLTDNLKSAIEDVAEVKVDSRISTLENWKDDITATTTELNYLSGSESNIQQQINAITGVLSSPFPTWNKSTPYAVGDICIASNFNSYKYLECVVAGTSGTTMPSNANVGQLVTDNEIKWLICDFRDSAPVGAFRSDMVQRKGWLKANGATVNRIDYPRLWAYAVDNNLVNSSYTPSLPLSNYPGLFGEGDGETTFTLPNFEDYFIRYSFTRVSGHKEDSQMAEHTHTCQDHTGSHDHTSGNQSANHSHSCGNQDTSHTHTINSKAISHYHSFNSTTWAAFAGGSGIGVLGGSGSTSTTTVTTEHNHTAGNQSANHKHSIGNQSANHNHIINSKSITHKHTIDPAGSGTNTYPDNIAMEMYIKY